MEKKEGRRNVGMKVGRGGLVARIRHNNYREAFFLAQRWVQQVAVSEQIVQDNDESESKSGDYRPDGNSISG